MDAKIVEIAVLSEVVKCFQSDDLFVDNRTQYDGRENVGCSGLCLFKTENPQHPWLRTLLFLFGVGGGFVLLEYLVWIN